MLPPLQIMAALRLSYILHVCLDLKTFSEMIQTILDGLGEIN